MYSIMGFFFQLAGIVLSILITCASRSRAAVSTLFCPEDVEVVGEYAANWTSMMIWTNSSAAMRSSDFSREKVLPIYGLAPPFAPT